MKLFVWMDPVFVKWGGSIAYVVANDVDEAREKLKTKGQTYLCGLFPTDEYGEPDLDKDPDRILPIKNAAEIFLWEE